MYRENNIQFLFVCLLSIELQMNGKCCIVCIHRRMNEHNLVSCMESDEGLEGVI